MQSDVGIDLAYLKANVLEQSEQRKVKKAKSHKSQGPNCDQICRPLSRLSQLE